jgi:LmbE family N-acetylglucosaminyl deacetylase
MNIMKPCKNILAIGAHPDDVEFGCFGTLKKHISKGDKVTICLMSNSTVKDASTGKKTRTRKDSIIEAQLSSDSIGANLIMLDFQDTKIPFNSITVSAIEKVINTHKIDTIYTHWGGDTHQDHVNTLNATLAASRMVNNVFCYEQVPLPRVCVSYPIANYFVDISNYINDKINACKCHKSQIDKYSNMGIKIIDNIKTLAKYRGNQSNVTYAEAFNVLKIVEK